MDSNSNNPLNLASTRKANKDLTPQERAAKRKLKKQLKVRQKRAKLESRLRHALTRNDTRTEQETRKALEKFHSANSDVDGTNTIDDIHPYEKRTPERQFVLSIFSQLQLKQQQQNGTSSTSKQEQTDQAVELLRNMTKGTQSRKMFENRDAIHGYTRQKFFERAMLVALSFAKLRPRGVTDRGIDYELRMQVWEKLKSIRRICSIGAGPGNDTVGVLAFLKAIGEGNPQLEHALLLDWAMDDWKIIVDPLCEIIVPTNVQSVDMSTCNISESLLDSETNRQAKELLMNDTSSSTNFDLFLISYLLTEVRGKFDIFLRDLVGMAAPQALFYFAEPTPWQLHRVRELFGDILDFIWLDSSMDEPEMQPLDNRLGPAVLLGRRKRAVNS